MKAIGWEESAFVAFDQENSAQDSNVISVSAKETESESFSLLEKGTPSVPRKNSSDQSNQKYEVCFENITQQVFGLRPRTKMSSTSLSLCL